MTTNIYAYDTECSGLETRYDRPFQYAAGIYDDEGNLLKELNLRGRLPKYVIPSPAALLVTGQSIGKIQDSKLSQYELIGEIHDHIKAHSPAVMISYNGIKYDEEVLRHSFYANLRAPYVTQFDGNTRMDIMIAAKAVAACASEALRLPVNAKCKKSFKLEDLAAANGMNDHIAHDAMGDVRATMHLAKEMISRAPEVWSMCERMRHKAHVENLMEASKPLLHVGWDGDQDKPLVQALLPICRDDTNPNEWLCVNLQADINRLLAADVGALKEGFNYVDGVRDIVSVKTNKMPILLQTNDPIAAGILVRYDPFVVIRLKNNANLVERLKAASTLRRSEFDRDTPVAEQLYSGGFFPMTKDKGLLNRFHQVSPHEKYEMISNMSDSRARHMGRRLIGSEWPEVMSKGDRQAIEEAFREHIMQEHAKWTTIPSALEEIKQLAVDASADQQILLEEYEGYLLKLQHSN